MTTTTELAKLIDLAEELAAAEKAYRHAHDHLGGGDIETGRAWDRMRKAGIAVSNQILPATNEHRALSDTTPEPDAAVPVAWMMTADGYRRPAEFYREKPNFVPPISKLVPLYATPQSAAPPAPVPAGEDAVAWLLTSRNSTAVVREVWLYPPQEGGCISRDFIVTPLYTHPMPASAVDGREGDALVSECCREAWGDGWDEYEDVQIARRRIAGKLIAAALRTRTPGPAVVDDLRRWLDFWAEYASMPEHMQDDIRHEKDAVLAEMTAALTEQRPSEQEGGR